MRDVVSYRCDECGKGRMRRAFLTMWFTIHARRARIADVWGFRCTSCRATDVEAGEFERARRLADVKANQLRKAA